MRRPKKSSNGEFNYETWNPFWDKRINSYTNDFEYSVAGKIKRKNQNNTGLLTETGQTVTIAETTYDWTYEYSGTHPNAVTKAGTRSFSYDMNGNMTQMTDTKVSLNRTLLWDEENRLLKTTDTSGTNSNITTYTYDAKGMRALKKGKYGTVQYVSENYTVRNKDLISKHVFVGNTRLVSKVVMNEEKSGKMVATEQGSYFYHADHLGSSSVVTDKSGKFFEHIEYFPYGETWVHNKATSEQESTPYKFTSKELDSETGLYYFGARYYDPKLSRWVSADPALVKGDYFPNLADRISAQKQDKEYKPEESLPGMGGVYNSINLDAHHYAGDNPVRYIDPNGEVTINLIPKDEPLHNWMEKTVDPVNTFTVAAHGNINYSVDAKGKAISPEKMADMIIKDKKFKPGMAVRLLSCNTGVKPKPGFFEKLFSSASAQEKEKNSKSYAEKVADALRAKLPDNVDVRVEAPNNILWVGEDGSQAIGPRQFLHPQTRDDSKPGCYYYWEKKGKGAK